jgi:excisionase family DNA binding protein
MMGHGDSGAVDAVADGPVLNLKQVAADLRVHYMTAYRYVRQGRLHAERQGSEWRIRPSSLEEFKRVGSAGTLRSEDARESNTAWDRRLETCLVAGDEAAAWNVIETVLASGHSPTFCYLDVIASALNSIGVRWAEDELDVADQFLATAVAVRLVARLGARFRRPGRSRGTVVFGAPVGELHSLPIAIVSDLVRLGGYDVLELGANVPTQAFVSAVTRTPRLVCVGIGVTRPEFLGSAQSIIDAIREVDSHIPVILGGLVTVEFERVMLRGVTATAKDGSEAVALIEALSPQRKMRRAV